MLLPAVNLININVSRIMERASEIGVRKAFGASSLTLVGQFVVENVLLTLIGGAIGLSVRSLCCKRSSKRLDPVRGVSPELSNLPLWAGACGLLRPVLRRLPGVEDVAAASGPGAEGRLAMIRHLFKMVWNRKRTNFLITVEIFFSFLVLFAVVLFAVYYTDNYRRPLGFSYENVWNISIERDRDGIAGQTSNIEGEEGRARTQKDRTWSISQLFLALREFGEIEPLRAPAPLPHSQSTSSSGYELNGREVRFQVNSATDSFADTMGLTLVRRQVVRQRGRWRQLQPVIINERMSREVFGDDDPIGQNISPEKDWKGNPRKEHRACDRGHHGLPQGR